MHNFISVARGLVVLAFGMATLMSLWGDADKHRRAKPPPDGKIEFALNRRSYCSWPLVITYLTYATIHRSIHVPETPLNLFITVLFGSVAVAIATSFPSTIVVSASGLEQIFWLRKNKRIGWENIVEINAGENSRTVTITGEDGTKIVHSRQLPDRPRLLMEIKSRCGENLPADFPREPITSS